MQLAVANNPPLPPTKTITAIYSPNTQGGMKELFRTTLAETLAETEFSALPLYDCKRMQTELRGHTQLYGDFFRIQTNELSKEAFEEYKQKYPTAQNLRFEHVQNLWSPRRSVDAQFWMYANNPVIKAFEIEDEPSPINSPYTSLEWIALAPVTPNIPMSKLFIRRGADEVVTMGYMGVSHNPYNPDHKELLLDLDANDYIRADGLLQEEIPGVICSSGYEMLAQQVLEYTRKRLHTDIDLY